jgi:heat shock protein HslJ
MMFLFILSIFFFSACQTGSEPESVDEDIKSVVPDAHSSRQSLDWEGFYSGTLPCADCEGIQMEILLKKDQSYEMASRYLGKSNEVFTQIGEFEWSAAGNSISLLNTGDDKAFHQYQVGENRLFKLDAQGKRITGDLAAMYTLAKRSEGLEDKYWKLIAASGKPIEMGKHQKREAYLVMHSSGNRAKGFGGCNSFSANYILSESNGLKFSEITSSMKACDDHDTELAFFEALESAGQYALSGDTLILFKNAGKTPLARFEAVYLY